MDLFRSLQDQWLIASLFGGTALMLIIVCAYLMMWRPRSESNEPIRTFRQMMGWIPSFIIILFIFIIIFQISFTIILHYYPPNI